MAQDIYIALDLGGTKFMVAAIGRNREIISRERADTPKSLSAGLSLLKEMIRTVAKENQIIAIGASAGGPLDYQTGIISPLHFPEWRDVPLKEILEKDFNAPFAVDVDTNAAVLAEYQFGGHVTDRLLYITLSTGMGGGFLVDGKIYRGANGSHPEVAHQAIAYKLPIPGPIKCPCGGTDCLEAVVCGTAIRKIYGKPAEELLQNEWEQVGYNLGQGLRNLAVIYAPSVIVLGGGMALGGGSRLIDQCRMILEQNLKIVPVPKLVFSKLGYDTALWGAFALALEIK